MERDPFARISRVKNSWRVRLRGHPHAFFADSVYGGTEQALRAARAWRDARWDGKPPGKLTSAERLAIGLSGEPYWEVAEAYGIHPHYVHKIRRRIRSTSPAASD